ncbi:MAG: type II toxin-antitoxin system PemK/MazF family toxin [Pirellulales bacterium]
MPLSRGEIVLVQFPYSSGAGSKLRPAVVVQPDHNNRRLTNVILAPITTTIQRAGESTQYLVDASSSAGKAAGLRHTSVITCENLTTVDQSLVRRRLGRLPPRAMDQVNACLKAALGLS